jgi:polysaccharide export outer membrane protein
MKKPARETQSMNKIFLQRKSGVLLAAGLLYLMGMLSSCGDTRQLTYMQGKFDTAKLSQLTVVEPTIKPGDLLGIVVYSDNPKATAIYNQSVITVPNAPSTQGGGEGGNGGNTPGEGSGSTPALSPGYQVDVKGNIQFQGLGILHVEGLTKADLKNRLDSSFMSLLTNPYYTIRFLNYRFTLLGEINKPGVYSMPGENINIFQALGLAGDMTFYGRRDNVLVMRQANGKREYARLDLTKPDVVSSPYYYLQQNDLIYIEATKRKVAANDQVTARNVAITASIVSTIAIVYSILK